jgi:hypothetical protein
VKRHGVDAASILPDAPIIMASPRPIRLLRSIVVLLTLVSAASAQFVMLACPMAVAPIAASAATQAAAHAGHAHHTPDSELALDQTTRVEDGSAAPQESSCSMTIGCGTAGIAPLRAAVAAAGALNDEASRGFTATGYAAVFPAHETPPPRFQV